MIFLAKQLLFIECPFFSIVLRGSVNEKNDVSHSSIVALALN